MAGPEDSGVWVEVDEDPMVERGANQRGGSVTVIHSFALVSRLEPLKTTGRTHSFVLPEQPGGRVMIVKYFGTYTVLAGCVGHFITMGPPT